MVNALFVCGRARLRSPTAAQVFASWRGVETDFGGLNPDADTPLSADQIDWADIVFVMEPRQRAVLTRRFRQHLKATRIVCLSIPDRYGFMEPELVRLLEAKAGPLLRAD